MTTINTGQELKEQLLSCYEVLRIAQSDAEKAYRDLSKFRISLVLQSDGWHVDII